MQPLKIIYSPEISNGMGTFSSYNIMCQSSPQKSTRVTSTMKLYICRGKQAWKGTHQCHWRLSLSSFNKDSLSSTELDRVMKSRLTWVFY